MKSGINQIGEARLCVSCQTAMAPEYVMRCALKIAQTGCHAVYAEKRVIGFWSTNPNG